MKESIPSTEQKASKDTPKPKSSRFKRFVRFICRPKIAIPCVFLILLITAPFVYRTYRLSQLPDIDHPFDLEAFMKFEVPDEENAYVDYRQAAKRIVTFKGNWDDDVLDRMYYDSWSQATPAFQNWLKDNQPALAIWKKGTTKPNAQYIPYREMSLMSDILEISSELRDLARLVNFQTMKLHHEKKYAEIHDWNRALFRFSRHVGQNGSFTERTTGYSFLWMAEDSIQKWMTYPEVDVTMLKKALSEIETDYDMTSSISRTMKAEYVICEQSLRIIESPNEFESGNTLENFGFKWFYYFMGEPELSRRILKHCYTNWYTQIEKPRYLQTERISGDTSLFQLDVKRKKETLLPPDTINSAISSSQLGGAFVSSNLLWEYFFLKEQTRYHCLRIAIVAEIYKREHGSYPEKLEALKEPLGEIPFDPFYSSSRRDLQYRRENDGFIVWSVGEDERDELGAVDKERLNRFVGDDIGIRIPKNKPEKKQSKK